MRSKGLFPATQPIRKVDSNISWRKEKGRHLLRRRANPQRKKGEKPKKVEGTTTVVHMSEEAYKDLTVEEELEDLPEVNM